LLNRERDSERGGAPLKFCPLPLPREAYAKGPGAGTSSSPWRALALDNNGDKCYGRGGFFHEPVFLAYHCLCLADVSWKNYEVIT
jgi:hypothetical protein